MKEYRVEMKKDRGWTGASVPMGGPTYNNVIFRTYEKAAAAIADCRAGWRDLMNNPGAWDTFLRCRPLWVPESLDEIEFRIIARDVTEWAPIK